MQQEFPQQPPPTPPGSTPPASGFFPWLRNLGITRSNDERWFAGVAGGIAEKAGIDPLIVRGIIVALAVIGGPGILLYLAGWLLLPDRSGKIEAEELVKGRASTGAIIGLVIVGLWLASWFASGLTFPGLNWGFLHRIGIPAWMGSTFTWIFWLAILIAVGYVIHRTIIGHGSRQPATSASEQPSAPPSPETYGVNAASQSVTEKANAWSAEYTERYNARKLGSAHVLITLALALIAGGLTALLVHQSGYSFSSTQIPAVVSGLIAATSVLALSMVIAGLRGKSSGGIGFLGFVGAVALAVSALIPAGATYTLLGQNNITESTPASFSLVGDTNLDLTIYDSTPDITHLEINQLIGDVNLEVSNHRPTYITMDVAAGSINGQGMIDPAWGEHGGVFNRRSIIVNESSAGIPLHLNVRLGAGTIYVTQSE